MAKDAASEYCHIYFLKEKSDTTLALADIIIKYEVESDHKIRVLQSDNGSEFINEKNRILMLKEHIDHITSAPRTPQQNGMIEKEIGTITNMARIMLLATKLPQNLWEEPMTTACYLKNRLPTKRSKLTPYERFTGRKPLVKHLVNFGTEVHVLINWDYRHKFDPKTVPGIVLGYTHRSNTYRVYIPTKNNVTIASDLIFEPHKWHDRIQPNSPYLEITQQNHTAELPEANISCKNSTRVLDEFFKNLRTEEGNYEAVEDLNLPSNQASRTQPERSSESQCSTEAKTSQQDCIREDSDILTEEQPREGNNQAQEPAG